MRERLLDMLSLPRQLVRDNIERNECRHNGQYAPGDPRCVNCGYGIECEWLYRNDEFSALAAKPTPDIVDALAFASNYVDAHVTLFGHRRNSCGCEACRWLREAESLLQQAGRASFGERAGRGQGS